jgi:Ser-tRNA(Ala) deacylase AlaX
MNGNEFDIGIEVELLIDKSRRNYNSKVHTAGHLIDYIFTQVLLNKLKPLKGYHFPDGPYIEYIGEYQDNLNQLTDRINEVLKSCILQGFTITTEIVNNTQELKDKCYFVPERIPENKPIRIVTVYGEKGVPCGGTHVRNISELERVVVTKIKTKGGNTRIGYSIVV